jgi:hypothetical protein
MRYRHIPYFRTDTQYKLQKNILQPYAVVNGVQIYNDTLEKKYCFYTDELGRIQRGYNNYAQLLVDLTNYLAAATNHFPPGTNAGNVNDEGGSADA